jgi:ABC-type nitrate/sulfonate/bicarbonate transport system substrate-binding protein
MEKHPDWMDKQLHSVLAAAGIDPDDIKSLAYNLLFLETLPRVQR